MDRSTVMRRPGPERFRSNRRSPPFAIVVGLAALAWALIVLGWFALNTWLA